MRLDYNPSNGYFILRLPRTSGISPQDIMSEHGLDFSETASTSAEAVLFTQEPYAAAAFYSYATAAAQAQLLALQTQIDASWAKGSDAHIDCPSDQELWPFQKGGVEYSMARQNSLIGDVPGLGKTAQAVCIANEMRAKRTLILCPANIRLQWVKMIRRWSTMRHPFNVYPILHGRHGVHPDAEWTVVSYDLARTAPIGRALAKGSYDLLVLDEAHYLKTIDSQRTRAVFGGGLDPLFEYLASRCAKVVALSGTPLPNRPREAYTLARGLCWDSIDFMSEDKFRERFNPALTREVEDKEGNRKIITDERAGRHGELQSRLRANFMVRREKHGPNGVMEQLKLPIYDIVQVEETGAIKQALHAESMLDIDPENLEGADAAVLGHIAVVRRMMGLAIAPLAAEYCEMLVTGGEEKLLVFAWHIDVLNILEKHFAKYGVVRIDGSVLPARKQKLVDQFRTDPSIRFCIGNLLSLGTGTDGLQEVCDHAIFAEADWTAGNNQQGVDRLDRGGQLGQVQADFLVARGSFSERILASSIRKNQTTFKALDRII